MHPPHLFHDPLGTRADTLANLFLVCRGKHAKTGEGLAKNEAFSAPSSFFFFLCHGGALNRYSKGTRAERNDLCLVLGTLPASDPFHKNSVSPCGTWVMYDSGEKLTLHLIGWSTFGLNFEILFFSLAVLVNGTSVIDLDVSGL